MSNRLDINGFPESGKPLVFDTQERFSTLNYPSSLSDWQFLKPMIADGFRGMAVGTNSTISTRIGTVRASAQDYAGVWMSQSAPTVSNYSFLYAAGSIFNTPTGTTMNFRVNNSTRLSLNTSYFYTYVPTVASNGNVSAPSYSFQNYSSTGMYSEVGNLDFTVSGTKMMSIDTTGVNSPKFTSAQDTSVQSYTDYPYATSFNTSYPNIVAGSASGNTNNGYFYDWYGDGVLYDSSYYQVGTIDYVNGYIDFSYSGWYCYDISYQYTPIALTSYVSYTGSSFANGISVTKNSASYAGYFSDGSFSVSICDGSYAGIFYDPNYSSYVYLSGGSYAIQAYGSPSLFTYGSDSVYLCNGTYSINATGEGFFQNVSGSYAYLAGANYGAYVGDPSNNVYLGDGNYAINATGATKLAGGLTLSYTSTTTTYTISTSDYLVDCTSGTFTTTLPTASSVAGKTFVIKNSGTGTITVDGDSSETIDGQLTQTLNQYDSITVVSNGSNWIII
jgi:hypothetical protein